MRHRSRTQLADRLSSGIARLGRGRWSDPRRAARRATARIARSPRCSAARRRRECDLAPVPRSRCRSPTPGSASDRALPSRSATTTSSEGGSIAHPPRPGGSRSNTCRGPWTVRPGSSSTGRVRASRRSIRSGQSRHPRIHQGRRATQLRLLSPLPVLSIPTRRCRDSPQSPWQPGAQRPATAPVSLTRRRRLAPHGAPCADAKHLDAPRVADTALPAHRTARPNDADSPVTIAPERHHPRLSADRAGSRWSAPFAMIATMSDLREPASDVTLPDLVFEAPGVGGCSLPCWVAAGADHR
jgi:hypothetical protein